MGIYDSNEKKSNEVFLGNTNKIKNFPPPHLSSLKTIRLGKQAYYIDGTKISTDYCLPIFIDKSEYDRYNQIMDGLTNYRRK